MNKYNYQNHVTSMLKILLLGCFLAVGVGATNAATTQLTLVGAAETPPVKTSATGTGSITVNADKTVSGSVTTTGLVGTVAHIHLGAEGKKGPVIILLTKSGENSWSVPSGSILTDAQFASYKAGNLYVNVHTAKNMDGEIRGQLMP
ncbi:CHRD domain-containing protein [Solimicrobium silvestre]|uniref:CHRD domain n=1 Tax=Solimicrobium silvestre TaxID=2099400 RepID=A0A2S9GXJ4_9BURK|nr:CHRD domain-containing protein [Solimicrobium silvestre]PRC92447.1 CHRD domain [Solimicrobium silvestre]